MHLRVWPPFIGAVFVLAACGGSVSSVPVTQPALSVASASSTATSNAVLGIPAVGALSVGTVTLPAVSSGSGASITVRTSIGASAVQSGERRAESIANTTAFAQVTITTSAPVTFSGDFTVKITYAGGPATYYGTFQDPAGALTSTPQLTAAGTTYAFSSPSGTFTLTAGQSVSFSFTAAQTANAVPATTPSPAATPGPLSFTPATFSFRDIGSAASQTATVTEPNYTGAFTATSENASVATASISGATMTIVPVGVGTTSIDVAGGTTGKISVTVTTSPVVIQ